jgi:hypothetical protein
MDLLSVFNDHSPPYTTSINFSCDCINFVCVYSNQDTVNTVDILLIIIELIGTYTRAIEKYWLLPIYK